METGEFFPLILLKCLSFCVKTVCTYQIISDLSIVVVNLWNLHLWPTLPAWRCKKMERGKDKRKRKKKKWLMQTAGLRNQKNFPDTTAQLCWVESFVCWPKKKKKLFCFAFPATKSGWWSGDWSSILNFDFFIVLVMTVRAGSDLRI